ncbi:uncharacterized protein N0V89_005711 [Didymosphaeria variabile]|uniref:Cyclin C-terminal domain-containing protein n=1 Tax=Didymosphaeria variabile TaxID=1932322 RepID=A0A9W9CBR4_9PLEO|nr:uncharacterized protein N0V89_005711 [Didymosphaeria variabile]KAJ4353979.1 hypothetical protein N0V89_005711 [Didymosphaeria variabile]
MRLNEDDLYRQSTQYKHWSFTPSDLTRLRQKTNAHAATQVKLHIAQDRVERAKLATLDVASAPESGADTPNGNGAGTGANTPVPGGAGDKGGEVDCLTTEEENMVVDKFCETAMKLGDFLKLQPDVTATAIQFMRRFYLYNSPMTYDGTKISKTAFFLALKLELGTRAGSASDFASRLPKTSRDDIVAPEYTIVQALRFNFEVRHPFRGLKGVHLELEDMIRGNYAVAHDGRTPAELRGEALQALEVAEEEEAATKLGNIYAHTKDILTMAAQLTDAYFLYTPSQILLAAHLLASPALTTFYLATKIPSSSPASTKILSTLQSCADLLSSHRSYSKNPAQHKLAWADGDPPATKKAMKKLRGCKDPTTQDLVALNAGKKRDVVRDGTLEEGKAKRRKLNRETAEKENDAFWGPELKKEG